MNLNNHFGKTLKNYIENNKLNAAGYAEKMGITAAGFYAFYKSKNPYDETKRKILNALGITEEELFGIEERKVESDLEIRYSELEKKLMQANEELLAYKRKEIKELQEANH